MSRPPITFARYRDTNSFLSNRGNYVAKWMGWDKVNRWRIYHIENGEKREVGHGFWGFELLGRAAMRDEAERANLVEVK